MLSPHKCTKLCWKGVRPRDVIQYCIYMTMQQPLNSFTQPNIECPVLRDCKSCNEWCFVQETVRWCSTIHCSSVSLSHPNIHCPLLSSAHNIHSLIRYLRYLVWSIWQSLKQETMNKSSWSPVNILNSDTNLDLFIEKTSWICGSADSPKSKVFVLF